MEENSGFNINGSCFNFSQKEVTVAVAAKATVGSLSFIACAVVILLIVVFQGYKRFVYRLIVYFMTADLIQSFAQVFEVVSVSYDSTHRIVEVRDGWATACVVFGAMDQLSMWMSNLVITWIMLYLFSLACGVCCAHNRKSNACRRVSMCAGRCICKKSLVEVFGLLFVILMPFTFNWVPFLWDMYGFSGLFCWIKAVYKGNCNDRTLSTILMFSMSYGPLLSLVLLGFFGLLIIIVMLCGSASMVQSSSAEENNIMSMSKIKYKRAMKEIAFALTFPILYDLLCLVIVANRLYSITHSDSKPVFPLWIAHVIASPGRLLVSPIGFLLHPFTWQTLICRRRHNGDNDTQFTVEPEDDDIDEPIIIRGTPFRTNYGSVGLIPDQSD